MGSDSSNLSAGEEYHSFMGSWLATGVVAGGTALVRLALTVRQRHKTDKEIMIFFIGLISLGEEGGLTMWRKKLLTIKSS
jgi:hypothetical protein